MGAPQDALSELAVRMPAPATGGLAIQATKLSPSREFSSDSPAASGPIAMRGQADQYHTPAIRPDWHDDMERMIRFGDHIFYADSPARG